MKTTNKTIKKILSIVLCLALVMSYVPAVSLNVSAAAADLTVTIDTGASVTLKDADGDGYYDIGTADELYAFAAAVNGGNTNINGELTADIVVNENVLDENGDLNGTGSDFRVWTPIGEDNKEYCGTFDGNEYTILGLYFYDGYANYVGLFGYVYKSGKVQNVGVEDFYFYGRQYVGGVVGYNYYGTITNCHSAGTVTGTERVGGVVGYNYYGTITNCHSAGTVTGTERVGGVVGYNDYGSITNCYNTGAVKANSNIAGGVVGNNFNGPITNCYSTGAVMGNNVVGGVAGYNYTDGTITNCYNTGAVKANYNIAGGVVGQSYGTVTNSYNIATVDGYGSVGAIAGVIFGGGTVTNCYYLVGSSNAGIGEDKASDDTVISEVTEAQVKAASGEDDSLIDMLNEWVVQQNDVKDVGWHFCSNISTDYPSLNLECTYSDNGETHVVECTLCGSETTEAHTYFYTANNGAISENCEQCKHSASVNPILPEAPVYNGNAHEASYTGSFANPDATVLIQYVRHNEDFETGYEILESPPVDAGTYIVRLSVGEIYADSIMTIAPKEISLIGVEVEYKDYDGTPYVEIDPYYGYGGFKVEGVLNYDSIKILCDSAELESANAGSYDKVTVKGLTITGEDAHNYTIVSEETIPVYNIWGNSKSSVTVYERFVDIKLFDQEAGSLDAIDQSKWEIDEYYGLLEGHRIESVKLVAEMNDGSTKYGSISVEEGSVKIVDADGNDVTANYGVSAYSATLTLTCPDHDEFEHGFCKNCGGYEKATYNENEYCYEIENAGQLFWFAEYIANVSNEADAKLTDNITIPEGKEWTPIYNLYGTFDGNYKTISGLQVNDTDSDYVGFLGYIGYYASVRNLHITNSSFVDTDATYVGAIVGYHGGGEITNCYTDETVKIDTNGICGALAGYTAYTTMKNCYAHGALAGNGHYGTFENCYYIGEDDGIDGTTAVTAEQLKSGEVAYLLQSGQPWNDVYDEETWEVIGTEQEAVWFQTIGTDDLPTFDDTSLVVYRNILGGCCEENYIYEYSNTEKEPVIAHVYTNGFCTGCDDYQPAEYNETDGAYEIGNAGQLYWFAELVNSGTVDANAILINDIVINENVLDENGSLNEGEYRSWTPIGYYNSNSDCNKYQGTFDGNNKVVSGLYINDSNRKNVGLFGYVYKGKIKNTGIEDSYLYADNNVGGIVGYITRDGSAIDNCYNKGYVGGVSSVGGVCGFGYLSTITACFNAGNVFASNIHNGGIAGDIVDATITNSYNTGSVDGDTWVGGVVGSNGGIINNCYNTGSVNGENIVGGVVGSNAGTVSNCYNAASVSGSYNVGNVCGVSSGSFENVYYLATEETDEIDGTTFKTAEQFASGEVAYLLQQGNTEQVWGQDSNQAGAMPMFDLTGLYKVVTVGETGNYSVANVGDTNADGTVDVEDYQALVNEILSDSNEQIETASYDDIVRYDLDGDGYLDVIDASVMHLLINGFATVDVYAVGDYDLNGVAFEEADILAMADVMENPEKLATNKKYACDLNADGKVSFDDLNTLTSMFPLYFVGEE